MVFGDLVDNKRNVLDEGFQLTMVVVDCFDHILFGTFFECRAQITFPDVIMSLQTKALRDTFQVQIS